MTTAPLDTDAIQVRAIHAEALIQGNSEHDEYERDEQDLRRLVTEDVNQMLLALEQREVNGDVGYVTGLYAAAQWLAQYANGRRHGYDEATCRHLSAGLAAMVLAAVERLGQNPDGVTTTDWVAGDVGALEAVRRTEQVHIDVRAELARSGHGWVVPRTDGLLAKCGGPAVCRTCAADTARLAGSVEDASKARGKR